MRHYYHYYDKNDNPIKGKNACMIWAKQFEDAREGRIIGQVRTWLGFFVSTVWIGLNHNFTEGRPHIYETMVFPNEQYIERYATRKEAIAGHKRMVLKWSNPLYILYRFIQRRFL